MSAVIDDAPSYRGISSDDVCDAIEAYLAPKIGSVSVTALGLHQYGDVTIAVVPKGSSIKRRTVVPTPADLRHFAEPDVTLWLALSKRENQAAQLQEQIARRELEDSLAAVDQQFEYKRALENTVTPEALAAVEAMKLKQEEEYRQMDEAQWEYETKMYSPVRYHAIMLWRSIRDTVMRR